MSQHNGWGENSPAGSQEGDAHAKSCGIFSTVGSRAAGAALQWVQSLAMQPQQDRMMSQLALHVRDLAKAYDRPAVDGLDLAVRPSEFYVLLGPNGAGKTT